jgi:virginiamycin B lyase
MEALQRSSVRPPRRARFNVAVAGVVALSALMFGAPPTEATAPARPRSQARIGEVTYFFVPSLHSRPFRITPGPDGNLWFTDSDSDLIGKITTSGEITEYPIGDGKHPYDIVAGRDGNIWFTENVNNKTGAVDTDGNLVHEYYAPGVDARPTGITVAPNGDVWWVNGGSGLDAETTVSHLLPEGTVVNHVLYPCACFGIGITSGPDGNLWAVEELGVFEGDSPGTIDRIPPDGEDIVRFPIPAPQFTEQHLPAWIAPGPDGKLWFTEYNSNLHQVGTITTGGAITEYQLPGDDSNTGAVTTGIDGRIWVTEPDANRVTILETDGSFLTSLGVHQQPFGITIGPDGNMWFTNALSGEIGRIKTAQPGVGYVLDIAPGFVPAERTISLGDTVQWVLEAPGLHEVEDATGLRLYDSGPRPPVSFLRHVFTAAGTYRYVDPPTGDAGDIAVPVDAPSRGRIGTPFQVTWATVDPDSGLVFDAQFLPPGSGSWLTWKEGVRTTGGTFVPTAGGRYQFRARIRSEERSAGSKWSPPESVVVS